ncbi:MAG: MBL fold metallo-hydrolase [Verrucomicrobiales bacterium]|nr:MBL fold metallo-hydrolase [Verrucomicrobiales bacterium]
MRVTFWGVRGSLPSPGPSTVRYGGNTPCVSIELGSDQVLVLDAGTGIRELGKQLARRAAEVFVLLTHDHWDHVQGFPFFIPIYQANRMVHVFATENNHRMLCSLIEQMDGAHFPVSPDQLPSQTRCVTEDPTQFMREHGLKVSRIAINHPGGGYGYRLEESGRTVVFIPDNELDPPYPKTTAFDEFVEFCRGADILIHDAQYVDEDMPLKRGWGHSLVRQTCELAAAAEVKHLLLYHHDPDRTDDALDALQADARTRFLAHHSGVRCTAAFEGLMLDV